METVFAQKDSLESHRTQESLKLKRILRNQFIRLRFGYLVEFATISNNFSGIKVDFSQAVDNSIIDYSVPEINNVLNLRIFYEYDLTNRLSFSGSIFQDLGKDFHLEGWTLGINYSFLLKSIGKPIFIEPEVFYGQSTFGYSSGKLENYSKFSLNGKTFRNEALDFMLGHRQTFVQPGFRLRNSIGTFGILKINFQLGFSYLWGLSDKRIALIQEKNEWALFKKKTKINLPNVEFQTNYKGLDEDNPKSTLSTYQIRAGFSFDF